MERQYRDGRVRPGFTLTEIMFAIGIFGVGLIAVSSLFPVAGQLQKNASEDIISQQVANSVVSELKVRRLRLTGQPMTTTARDITGGPMENSWLRNTADITQHRSYPTTVADAKKRAYYWIPVVRRDTNTQAGITNDNYQIFSFIIRAEKLGSVPVLQTASRSAGIPPGFDTSTAGRWITVTSNREDPSPLRVGEYVLGTDGKIYRVVNVVGDQAQLDDPVNGQIWYSRFGTTRRIVFTGNDGVRS